MSSLHPAVYFHPRETLKHIHDLATVAPLLSAVIAPIAVLYDIPALTEKWYSYNGEVLPDPVESLILSAIGLAATVVGNILLIIRFSSTERRWRIFTRLSVLFWGMKIIISVTNLIVFGATRRNGDGYSYNEGFWCAILSLILSGVVFALLLLHWALELKVGKRRGVRTILQQTVRVTGRHFMLQVTLFVCTVALIACIFSFIEGWSYLQGIYFATITLLTIGFGDFEPTHTATRILLFPFAILGIAQLGSILSLIVSFFADRAARRKARARALMEKERQIEQDEKQKEQMPDLFREIKFLVALNEKQDMTDRFSELAMSFTGFVIFWLVGAAIFSVTESWSYPISLYFCYIFFFAIGYGDYSPSSPAGRVVIIIYALIAVPIMASVAVSAVQGIVTQLSELRLAKRKIHEGIETDDSSDVVSHAEYVERYHSQYDAEQKKKQQPSPSQQRGNSTTREKLTQREVEDRQDDKNDNVEGKGRTPTEVDAKKDQKEDVSLLVSEEALTHNLIEHALTLERHARRLLMSHLPNGSKGQIILKADRNVQLRHLQAMLNKEEAEMGRQRGRAREAKEKNGGEEIELGLEHRPTTVDTDDDAGDGPTDKEMAGMKPLRLKGEDDPEWISHPLDDEGTMEEIRRYREAFAAFLATSSRLRKLEGIEMYKAERRLMDTDAKDMKKTRKEVRGLRKEVMDREHSQRGERRGVSDVSDGRTAVNDRIEGEAETDPKADTSGKSKGDRAPDHELDHRTDDVDDTL